MELPEFRLDGKVVLMAGPLYPMGIGGQRSMSGGIAEVLAHAGADVALTCVTAEYDGPAVAELARETGRRVALLEDMNLWENGGLGRVVARVLRDFGRLDVLVNLELRWPYWMPSVNLLAGTDTRTADEQLRSGVDVSLSWALRGPRAVGAHMVTRGSGKIVNVAIFTPPPHHTGVDQIMHAAATSGLVGITRALARQWAPFGLHVNGLAVGHVSSEVRPPEVEAAEHGPKGKRPIPLGRPGRGREVGLATLFLASSASDYMTGQTLYLDGGLSL